MGSNEYYYRALGGKVFTMSRRTFFSRRDRSAENKSVVEKLFREHKYCEICNNEEHSTHVLENNGLYFVICEECAHNITISLIPSNKKS